jgi:antitoxin ParD1/3/4
LSPPSIDSSFVVRYGASEQIVTGTIDLDNDLETIVTDLVASGRYTSKSEVVREGIRLIQEREAARSALDAALARGLAVAEAGRVKPASEVFDRLETKFRMMADAKRG